MLAPNQEDLRANAFGFMILNEGPLKPGLFVPSRGRVGGIVLMVDFPDFPGNGSAAATAELFALDRRYFDELSYGRFDLTLSLGDRWFRLPNPAETYFLGGDFRHRYFADAVAAADPYVDFSRCEEGVLVYDVDSRIGNAELRNGRGVVAIKGPRRCFGTAAGALRTGEVFEDSAVKVEVLARDAKAFRVRVTRK